MKLLTLAEVDDIKRAIEEAKLVSPMRTMSVTCSGYSQLLETCRAALRVVDGAKKLLACGGILCPDCEEGDDCGVALDEALAPFEDEEKK